MISCQSSGYNPTDHFNTGVKMVSLGSGSTRELTDYKISKYGCYLVAMNGDPAQKEMIAFAQAYFASVTCQYEEIKERLEYENRIDRRDTLRETEKEFSSNMVNSGVSSSGIARIRSNGDKAFFGGNTTQDMKDKYEISSNRSLADYAPSVVLSAKNMATDLTNYCIENNDISGECMINNEHINNNSSVRDLLTSKNICPEDLDPKEDIRKLERRINRSNKSQDDLLPKLYFLHLLLFSSFPSLHILRYHFLVNELQNLLESQN
jgi:DNA-damage-inducible protein D